MNTYSKREELVGRVREAKSMIAEAAEMLRSVATETNDRYRGAKLVANIEKTVGVGGWLCMEEETLDGWIAELEAKADDEEDAEAAHSKFEDMGWSMARSERV